MSEFARGTYAWGECQRCGFRVRYLSMVEDGHIPGLRVCPTCYEPEHPQENPPPIGPDRVALERPAPEVSIPDDEGTAAPDLEDIINGDV